MVTNCWGGGGGGKFGAFRVPALGWVTVCHLHPPFAWVRVEQAKMEKTCNYVVFEIQSMVSRTETKGC